jgi:hypothetical protein
MGLPWKKAIILISENTDLFRSSGWLFSMNCHVQRSYEAMYLRKKAPARMTA